MSRRDELMAKNAKIRAAADISDAEARRAAENHRPRSGQGSFVQRQKLEDRVAELEAQLSPGAGKLIPLLRLSPNPWQPRRVFAEGEIQELATSIAEVGLIQPIIVRSVSNRDTPDGDTSGFEGGNRDDRPTQGLNGIDDQAKVGVSNRDTSYQIVAGERRFRAHQLLGKDSIKAIIMDVSDADMAALALAENMDRTDLSAYEIAVAIRNAELNFSNRSNLAAAVGLNRTALYKYLAFFKLPDFVIADLEVRPDLLGRDAADNIARLLDREGGEAVTNLESLWIRVKSGELDQGKIVATIETLLRRTQSAGSQRDIRKLFVGEQQAGSITRDSANFTIKIRAAALTPDMEEGLRAFVESMFSSLSPASE